MASPFWTYIYDKLRWPLIHKPGSLQTVVKGGIAHPLDKVREDAVFLRSQWFPKLCEPELVPEHGYSRGIIRHLTETNEQYRNRVINAYAWHMLGGKWKGLPEILNFYGFNISELEGIAKYQSSRWAEFQVGLNIASNLETQNDIINNLETLIWLINEYKPARSVLARLYTNVYNITPLIFSEGKYSEHFYSHFSGVPVGQLGKGWQDDGLILSFGKRLFVISEQVEYGNAIISGTQQTGFIAPYIDSPVWSHFNYSESFPIKHGFTFGELLCVDWSVQTNSSYLWEGIRCNPYWAEFSKWDRVLPYWEIHCRSISRSQLIYGEKHSLWGDINACYSVPTAVVINNPPIWGQFAYSDNFDRQELTIHEQFLDRLSITVNPVKLQDGKTITLGVVSITAKSLKNRSWSGAWDGRRWCNDIGFFSVTSFKKE